MTQAQALDILTRNAGEVARRTQVRDLGGGVVLSLFRVVKLATLHAIDNQAMVRQVEEAVSVIQSYGQRTEQNVSVLFTQGSVFVGGQLLKASRAAYDAASELAEILKRCGAGEIHVARDVRAADFYAFATALAEALRSPTPVRVERPSPRIRLRSVNEAAMARGLTVERTDPTTAVVRTYASAVVIMRRFYEDLARGRYALPQRVKRVAQRLVDLSAGETPAFLGVTAARNVNHDDAGRAVNTAVLSLAIARQVNSDQTQLVRLAMSALLLDTARPRLLGLGAAGGTRTGIIPQLSEQQDDEVPAGTAVALTALGRVNEPSVMRTVIAYEAQWLKRQAHLGALYGGLRQPTLQARIVATARTFNDLLTPAPGQQPASADQAIAELEQASVDAADRTVLRLLVGALGIFPTGTLVELSTGEVALVVKTPADPARYPQPCVRLVINADGSAIDRQVEIDLSQQPADRTKRHIVRVVSTSDDSGSAALRTLATTPGASGVRSQQPRRPAPPPRVAPKPANAVAPARPAPAEPKATPPHSFGMRTVAYATAPAVSIEEVPDIEVHELEEELAGAAGAALLGPDEEEIIVDEDEGEGEPDPNTRAMPGTPDEIKAGIRASDVPHDGSPTTVPPAATATGDLARTPLVHLLVYMLDNRLTGTTIFHTPDGVSHGIFFSEGTPSKVRTGTIIDPLDRVILDLGLLDEATLRETLMDISRRHVLHGRHLVAKGLLDRETILSVLRLQMVRKITRLFELPAEAHYAYYEGANLLAGYGGPELTPCEPLALIMAGVRLRGDDPLVDATLERISGRRLGLRKEGDPRRFELQRHEVAVVDLLRTRAMTLTQLLSAGLGQDRIVKLTVYALAITRHLDLGVPAKLPVGVSPGDFRPIDMAAPAAPAAPAEPVAPRTMPAAPPTQRTAAMAAIPTPVVTMVPTLGASRTPHQSPAVAASAMPPSSGAQQLPTEPAAARSLPTSPVSAPPSKGGQPRTVRTGFGIAFGQQQPPPKSPPPSEEPSGRFSSPAPEPSDPSPSSPDRAVRLPAARAADALRASMSAVPTPSPMPGPDNRPTDPPRSLTSMSTPPRSMAPMSAPPMSGAPTSGAPGSSGPNTGRHTYTGEFAERKTEIDDRAAGLDSEDYFQVLGVARTANANQIQEAYFALAKTWHPDRQPLELVGHKVKVARIFSRMTEAYQTLSDPAKRTEYNRAMDQGGATTEDQRKVLRVVDAALEFQKAEILLRKHDLAGAEVLAARAVQADPDQPDYLTLLVWIQAQRRGEPPPLSEGRVSSHYDDLIKILDGVLTKEPRYERALFYRGMLLKRAGRTEKAIRDFRLAAEMNPRNLDAVREVRLHEMRRGRGGLEHPRGGPQGGGLFGKLFKK